MRLNLLHFVFIPPHVCFIMFTHNHTCLYKIYWSQSNAFRRSFLSENVSVVGTSLTFSRVAVSHAHAQLCSNPTFSMNTIDLVYGTEPNPAATSQPNETLSHLVSVVYELINHQHLTLQQITVVFYIIEKEGFLQ